MIGRILIALALFLLICIPGMGFIYVVGSYLSCAFVDGCYAKLGLIGVFQTVSIKGIFVRGGLLAAAFTLMVWPRIRHP
ncbi:conserved protein of unknown function [Burkholderia multivorans]